MNFAVAHAHKAAHGKSEVLEHAPHLAVTSFPKHRPIPLVAAFTTLFAQPFELRRSIIQRDARDQLFALFMGQLTHNAHGVLALHLKARVPHAVSQVATGGEDQQSTGIEVEPAHGNPFAPLYSGQFVEHRGAVLRIITTDDLAFWLVIDENAWQCLTRAT